MRSAKQQDAVFSFILNSLEQSGVCMLLYVLQSEGSSPGRQGFKMAVGAAGEMAGTIGGGIMEHKFVTLAMAKIHDDNFSYTIQQQVHEKESGENQSGMICSGRLQLLLCKLSSRHIPVIRGIISAIETNDNAYLQLTPSGIELIKGSLADDFYCTRDTGAGFLYRERAGKKNILHIIGGGHCSLALSKLMSDLDFLVHVYDERRGLNTMQQNTYAHTVTEIGDYNDCGKIIDGGLNVYVVIMTFGYRTDEKVLRSLMGKSFRYTGMLGSRRKVEKLFTQFEEQGIANDWLKQVRSPVGVPVRSQTAFEIAVSIAAEIIAEKNKDIP